MNESTKVKIDVDWKPCPRCSGSGVRLRCVVFDDGRPSRRIASECGDCYGSGRAGATRLNFEGVDVLLFESPAGFQFGIPINTFATFDQGAAFVARLSNALAQPPVSE